MLVTWRQLIFTGAVLSVLAAATPAQETPPPKEMLGDGNDGNRAIPVHLMDLLVQVFPGEPPEKIDPLEEPALPFSMRHTCGECHSYEFVQSGWHFNSSQERIEPGRRGEPWIWVDAATRSVIPVSGRNWPGTYKPQQVGLTPWRMIKLFGRHMPGGDFGQIYAEQLDGLDRIDVSGEFEINCLTCHNADRRQDQSEAALQVLRENFRWTPAAASGVAQVTGIASTVPPTYDVFMGLPPDDNSQQPPKVHYDNSRFDRENRVFFDIVRRVPNNRCYFCHSTQWLGMDQFNEWRRDEDVHLAAGLMCVDCHRHGVDHMMVRGYEGEKRPAAPEAVPSLTCRGCHILNPEDEYGVELPSTSGRLGAPRPKHTGIPLTHFDKLTCTACHSGPRPALQTQRVRTPRIHRLGLHGVHRQDYTLPHVQTPVFVRNTDGKIEPTKLIWPAFWGLMKNDKITPIDVDVVKQKAADILNTENAPRQDDWPVLSEEQIAHTLSLLKEPDDQVRAVYIAGGKLYQLDERNKLTSADHEAAQPYTWPMAHDVRSAPQSLGYNGRCTDCHGKMGPIFFGKVAVDTPLQDRQGADKYMYDITGMDGGYWRKFNASFAFRSLLKTVGFTGGGIIAAILLLFALAGLKRILMIFAPASAEKHK
ncbi:hypothetical protein ACFL02_02245 [Planctomycetota bacterium]